MKSISKSSNGKQPLVSVVIPVYNGESYIAEAIQSVRAQDYSSIEIIVVDDGSTDATGSVVASSDDEITYVRQSNQGPPAARNRGLGMACGEIVALLDADDRWPPDKLALQLPPLLEDDELDLVLGDACYFRLVEAPVGHQTIERLEPFFIFQLGCALFRRRVFDRVGLFDVDLRYGDDVDWFLRARELHVEARYVKAPTILYRRHPDNMTQIPGHRSLSRMAMLKRSLDRRRESGEISPMASWFR